MRDKKMFISAILITTVMLFVGGCGRQVEPVSAEPTETINEVYPEESLKPIPSPTALLEESMENSEDEHNSENGVNVEEIIDEDEVIIEDENVGEEAEPVKTEAPKTDTDGSKTNGSTNGGSKTNGSTNSGASSGSTNSGTSSGSTTNKPADPTPTPSPAPSPTPTHTHNWKEHTVTEQVWVPNIVVVDDYEERVVGRTDDEFVCDCGFKTTNRDTIADHIKSNVIAGNDGHGGFFVYEGHNIVEEVKVGSHEEDRGHNETQTYVDYYYCDCGATKK